MSEYAVIVELKGCPIEGDAYAQLDGLMAELGFNRRVHLPFPFIEPPSN